MELRLITGSDSDCGPVLTKLVKKSNGRMVKHLWLVSLKPAVVWKFIQSTLKRQIFFPELKRGVPWNPQNHPRSATGQSRVKPNIIFEK